jgi:hypothetical protein
VVLIIAIPFAGRLADRFGRRPMLIAGEESTLYKDLSRLIKQGVRIGRDRDGPRLILAVAISRRSEGEH